MSADSRSGAREPELSSDGEATPSAPELAQRVEILEGAPVFSRFPVRVLRILARRMQRLELSAGKTVVDIGEQDDSVYFVAAGRCESTVASGVPSFPVHTLGYGELFGLASAVLDAPQPFTVTTIEPTVLYVLTNLVIRFALDRVPGAIPQLEKWAVQTLEGYRLAQQRATSSVLPRGEAVVIPVYSASGGSGRTTVALNLAAALAADAPGRVLLIDLSLPYAHAALVANLVPTGSIASASRFGGEELEHALMAAALFHPSGMMVLPGTTRPDEAELVTAELVKQTLEALADQFSYMVVDMPVTLSEVALTVLDKAQQVVLVLTPDLSALQGANEAAILLEQAVGIPTQLITMVLNNRAPRAATSRQSIVLAINRPPDIEIRHDGNRPDRAALSGMLCFDDPRSSVRAAMVELVARVKDLSIAPNIEATGAYSARDGQ